MVATMDFTLRYERCGGAAPLACAPLMGRAATSSSSAARHTRQNSVGLPSQYPSHAQQNSLASFCSGMLEELQDFDHIIYGGDRSSLSSSFEKTSPTAEEEKREMRPSSSSSPPSSPSSTDSSRPLRAEIVLQQDDSVTLPFPTYDSTAVPFPNTSAASTRRIRQRAPTAGSSSEIETTASIYPPRNTKPPPGLPSTIAIVVPTASEIPKNDRNDDTKKRDPPRRRHRRSQAMGGTDFSSMVLTEL